MKRPMRPARKLASRTPPFEPQVSSPAGRSIMKPGRLALPSHWMQGRLDRKRMTVRVTRMWMWMARGALTQILNARARNHLMRPVQQYPRVRFLIDVQ